MIKLIIGERGSGKSKKIIHMVNEKVNSCRGDIVFIDDDKRPIYELHRKIRFISTQDYNITSAQGFYGFLCGILAQNYDVKCIFIDGICNIVKDKSLKEMDEFFNEIEELSVKEDIEFYLSANANEQVSENIKEYSLQ